MSGRPLPHFDRYVQEFAAHHHLRDEDTIDIMASVANGMRGKRLRYRESIAPNGLPLQSRIAPRNLPRRPERADHPPGIAVLRIERARDAFRLDAFGRRALVVECPHPAPTILGDPADGP